MNEQHEKNRHSFVITIWVEEEAANESARWRGHITHVLSKNRKYVQTLKEVQQFIEFYLDQMGVRPGIFQRLRGWFLQIRA